MKRPDIAVFGGGCFWCTEAILQQIKGVTAVVPGYAGGTTESPTYDEVSNGTTGHAEVVKIEFDPAIISYNDLLTVFFSSHDPTTLNQQGADIGTQYRSIILTTTPAQKTEAEAYVAQLNDSDEMGAPVVTEVKMLETFYEAEAEHHDFMNRNPQQPYVQAVINPKLAKVRQKFASLVKTHF